MQIDDISKLPERYQKQIMAKMAERERGKPAPAQRPKPGKYRNVKTEENGIKFDSKKEAKRYLELMARREAGEIDDLRLQVNFTLQEAFTKPDGERVRAIVYKADFAYKKRDGNGGYTLYIVEDVKSKATKTRTYEIKKKLMREKFRIEVQEV
jgi:hypothetical protein